MTLRERLESELLELGFLGLQAFLLFCFDRNIVPSTVSISLWRRHLSENQP